MDSVTVKGAPTTTAKVQISNYCTKEKSKMRIFARFLGNFKWKSQDSNILLIHLFPNQEKEYQTISTLESKLIMRDGEFWPKSQLDILPNI